MSNYIQQTLDDLKSRVTAKQRDFDAIAAEVNGLKSAANQLCRVLGAEPIYAEASSSPTMGASSALSFRIDQFTGKSLSESVAEYLDMRKASGTLEGPATVDEIYDALKQGGFKFETVGDENSKRAIKISLTKTTALFTRVSDGVFGLKRWYGMRGPRKASATSAPSSANGTPPEEKPSEAAAAPDQGPEAGAE